MNEEGWFKDPYQRHEARWMSAGTPMLLFGMPELNRKMRRRTNRSRLRRSGWWPRRFLATLPI